MLDSEDVQHFAQKGTEMSSTVMENPYLHEHVVPFGEICGLSELLRLLKKLLGLYAGATI